MALADTRYDHRRRALASQLASRRVDVFLVTNLVHVQYLTGFSGSNAALTVASNLDATMCTDGRYTTQISEEVPDVPAVIARPSAAALLRRIEGARRVGFEADYVSVAELDALRDAAPEDVELVPVRGAVEELRLVKDARELDALRDVAALASTAWEELLEAGELRSGRTERQVAADLEYRMRLLGADRTSFDTIVASGPNSAKPHHGAGDRVLQGGDLVTVDFGAHVAGFNSDMTRTVAIGTSEELSSQAQEIYRVVWEAQRAGVAAARPGTALHDVDKACRDVITQAGYGEYFVHSTGHGVGLEVHEGPMASAAGTGQLAEGMTLTIEPGIYLPGECGVRIEDTLIITRGEPEIITHPSKELRYLDVV